MDKAKLISLLEESRQLIKESYKKYEPLDVLNYRALAHLVDLSSAIEKLKKGD